MKKFIQVPSCTEQELVAEFQFVSTNTMSQEDPKFRELIRNATNGKMNISWKDGIICADCPSGEYAILPNNNKSSIELYKLTNHEMFWKAGDCTDQPFEKTLEGNFEN